MNILFLYRTPKKRNYFNKVKNSEPFKGKNINILSYNSFLLNLGLLTPMDKNLIKAHTKAINEVFHSRNFAGIGFVKLFYSFLISLKIKTLHRGLKKHFKSKRPEKVIIWNGLKYQDLVLKEVIKPYTEIEIFYMENGPLPNTTAIDSVGINAGSSLTKDVDFYKSYQNETENNLITDEIKGRPYITKSEQKKVALPESYILLPFQMERDSQVLDYSPWISNMEELFHTVFESLNKSELKNSTLVVREHPSTSTTYPELYQFSKDKNVLFDKATPLKEALKKAQCVVTINSSVGFESILLETKVIVLGEAFYNLQGLNLNANSSDDLVKAFNQIKSFTPDTHLKSKFVSYLKNEFLIKGHWSKPTLEHFNSFFSKVENKKGTTQL